MVNEGHRGLKKLLTLLFSIAMAQIAEREMRRGLLWGLLTFMESALIQTFLVAGYWGAVLGFFVSFGAMTFMKFRYPIKKGPTLG